MIELKTRTKKWGNSVGILLPKRFGVRADEDIHVHIEPAKRFTTVKDIFGTFKLKQSTKALMKEIDRELYTGE